MTSLSWFLALFVSSQAEAITFVPVDAEPRVAAERADLADARDAATDVSGTHAPATLTPGSTFSDCGDGCPTMVVIAAGRFLMGSAQYAREQPQHVVTFSEQFAVGRFDVTFDEWDTCAADGGCSGNPAPSDEGWGRGRRPVINVSLVDAEHYASWLSKKTGRDYRLPTEAEWEYVARAGSTTNYPWGDTIDCGKASYDGGPGSSCSSKTGSRRGRGTQPVGRYASNAWGVYDTNGNVWQWCEDSWHPDYRGAPDDGTAWRGGDGAMGILRGGAWSYGPSGLRSADRNWLPRSARTNFLGFRIARSLEADVARQ